MNSIYQLRGGAFFDAVGYHAYGAGKPSDWLPDALLEIRSVLDANGDLAKPVWIKWATTHRGSGAVSEQTQAEYLLDARNFFERTPSVERVYSVHTARRATVRRTRAQLWLVSHGWYSEAGGPSFYRAPQLSRLTTGSGDNIGHLLNGVECLRDDSG